MEKEKEEGLDKLFKKGMQDTTNEPVYREMDWEAMEQLLDQQKKRGGVVYWLPRLGSVAAVLLLALLAWFMFRPQADNKPKKDDQVAINSKPDTDKSSVANRHEMADSSKQKINTPANLAQNSAHTGTGKKTDRSFPYLPDGHAVKKTVNAPANVLAQNGAGVKNSVVKAARDNRVVTANQNNNDALATNTIAASQNKNEVNTASPNQDKDSALAANTPASSKDNSAVTTGDVVNQTKDNALVVNKPAAPQNGKDIGTADANQSKDNGNANSIADNPVKPGLKPIGVSNGMNRPVFAVMAIASSDMNSTSPLNGRLGGNLGALFSVRSGKWTFSTGGMYSIKPYTENFADYHTPYQFQVNPSTVGANCRMIDIPLNVNYQVYKQGLNKFTVGTGLSSYIILREDYTFNYAPTSAYGSPYNPPGYTVINRNRNIMSVLNLDVTYEHQINSKFGLILQPYYKLPLTNVGYSQVKLQSTGLAVGLNMNLNSFKKPN